MKKTILHFIYDLGRGGAETMLVRVLKELPEYDHLVVTLYPYNSFTKEMEGISHICLNQRSLLLFPLTAIRFRRLVSSRKIDLVHTHLFWPTIIARMAVPRNIPLVTTIHAFIATSVEYKRWFTRFLDKITYRLRKSVIISVAKGASEEYFSFLKLKPYKAYALYTFVDVKRFKQDTEQPPAEHDGFRMVSTGALRLQKNQKFFIEAFRLLKADNISLDIYGEGPLKDELQKAIDEYGLHISLKGIAGNLEEVLPQYDLFAMASTFEGFSLAVLEAMAMKLPLLLSDIVSFREQCDDTAIYFDCSNPGDFASKVKMLAADAEQRRLLAGKAYQRVIGNFTLEHHMDGLRKIYHETLDHNQ